MSMMEEPPCAEENLLFAREELASDIDLILKGDAHSPEALAHLLILLRRAINDGLVGINRASNTLRAAVELIYPHSDAHAAALELYRLSVEGQLKVEDEPVRLINAAIARSTARDGHAPRRAVKVARHARTR